MLRLHVLPPAPPCRAQAGHLRSLHGSSPGQGWDDAGDDRAVLIHVVAQGDRPVPHVAPERREGISCANAMAATKPTGPAPTTKTSHFIASTLVCIPNYSCYTVQLSKPATHDRKLMPKVTEEFDCDVLIVGGGPVGIGEGTSKKQARLLAKEPCDSKNRARGARVLCNTQLHQPNQRKT